MAPEEITPREFDLAIGGLKRSIEDLADTFRAGAEQSSREHAEVRGELRELRRQLDTDVPTSADFRELKQYLYRDVRDRLVERLDALESDRDLRTGGVLARAGMWKLVLGASTIMSVASLIRGFLPG